MGAFALLVTVASAASFSLASADTTAVPAVGAMTHQGRGGMMGAHKPGVMGTVTAISGNTITVTSKQFSAHQWGGSGTAQASPTTQPTPTTITYTVDATNATVKKNAATSAVSSIAVGDMVMVQGTVSGTSVTATSIIDGMGRGMGNGTESDGGGANIANLPAGNGQPIIGGAVTAVSGNTITITNTARVTYTIDATSAKLSKAGATTATISDIVVGDNVIAQGTVNGTTVTAANVIDQGAKPVAATSTSGANGTQPAQKHGFFGGIGSFFSHLFGF